jgi:hypothetical protein
MGPTGTAIYRTAARVLASTVLSGSNVQSVMVRRSVAAGEAEFPFSDLDLEIVVAHTGTAEMLALLRRYRCALVLFPRLGESFVVTVEDALEKALLDPYRASLDRRASLLVRGPGVVVPRLPVGKHDAARRLVFWFEHYLPRALRQGQRRNAEKFVLEMRNAWGVMAGQWEEPLLTRAETRRRTGTVGPDAFQQCCACVEQAAACLGVAAPRLRDRVDLPGVTIVPDPVWPLDPPATGMVVTPAALQLLLETQNPLLWMEHGEQLQALGFREPARAVWLRACRRLLGFERLRGPAFLGEPVGAPAARLRRVERALHQVEPARASEDSARSYYQREYPVLLDKARRLRHIGESLHGW